MIFTFYLILQDSFNYGSLLALEFPCTKNLNYQWEVLSPAESPDSSKYTFMSKEDCLLFMFLSILGLNIFALSLANEGDSCFDMLVVWTDVHQILNWSHLHKSHGYLEMTKWLVFYLVFC